MPAASLEDNLPFLLDEDPSRGSSKHGSQAGSSVHAPAAVQLPQQQHPALQPQQEQKSLQQPRRAWSVDPPPGMQVRETHSTITSNGGRHAGRLFCHGYSTNAGKALCSWCSTRRS